MSSSTRCRASHIVNCIYIGMTRIREHLFPRSGNATAMKRTNSGASLEDAAAQMLAETGDRTSGVRR